MVEHALSAGQSWGNHLPEDLGVFVVIFVGEVTGEYIGQS